MAYSDDGLSFAGNDVVVEGGGYDSDDLEAIHAEDMSLIEIAPDRYRMYYAACDRRGNWRLASAVSGPAVAGIPSISRHCSASRRRRKGPDR